MRFILAAVPLALAGVRAAGPTHGVVVGDVTSSRATVWSRSDEASTMQASVYECGARVEGQEVMGEVQVNSTNDFTGLVDLTGLADDTCYEVEVVFNPSPASSATLTPASSTASASGESAFATFKTAPKPGVATAVRFAWGGDISGQNVCRDADEGFPLMDVINGAGPYDFFLNVGDAIYGDGECTSPGLGGNVQVVGDFERSADLDNFWAHWKYNLEDPGYQTLLSSQAFFMTWDDHEVVDDFGPGFDERSAPPYNKGESLLPIGLQAFLNYNPIRATTDPTQPLDFYRSIRWGQSVELFILDTRQYRSLPTDEDTAANPKTMLGETQLAWLKTSLTDSTALWKMVVTSIPLSVPTGPGDNERDGWANFEGNTGYEIELEDILTHMKDGEMNNVVFITADVHFAQVLEYTPFARDPDFGFHEIIVGPLNAGPFRETDLDDSFSPERLFYYGPESNSLSGDMSYAEFRPFFNFGLAEIDLDGNLTISIINTDAETVYSTTLAARLDSEVPGGTVTPSPASAISGSSAGNGTAAPLATPSPSVAPDGEEPGADGSGTDGSGVGAGARPPQGFHRFFCGFSLVGVVGFSHLIGGRW